MVQAHLEVCFAAMARRPLAHHEKSGAGAAPGHRGEAGRAGAVEDVLGVVAVVGIAWRLACGEALNHLDPPEPGPDGWAAAIWTWARHAVAPPAVVRKR